MVTKIAPLTRVQHPYEVDTYEPYNREQPDAYVREIAEKDLAEIFGKGPTRHHFTDVATSDPAKIRMQENIVKIIRDGTGSSSSMHWDIATKIMELFEDQKGVSLASVSSSEYEWADEEDEEGGTDLEPWSTSWVKTPLRAAPVFKSKSFPIPFSKNIRTEYHFVNKGYGSQPWTWERFAKLYPWWPRPPKTKEEEHEERIRENWSKMTPEEREKAEQVNNTKPGY